MLIETLKNITEKELDNNFSLKKELLDFIMNNNHFSKQ